MTLSKKVKILLLIVSLSLTLSFMSNTYSRYVADTTGNLQLQFAEWQILVNKEDITKETSSTIQLTPVIDNENGNIADGKVAPSSTGYFDIAIDPSNVDVSFEYEISLSFDNIIASKIPDLMITQYSIIEGDVTKVNTNDLEIVSIVNNKISNTLAFDNKTNNFSFDPFTIRIYFEWFDGYDDSVAEEDRTKTQTMNNEDDTAIGHEAAANDTTFDISATIEFKQAL